MVSLFGASIIARNGYLGAAGGVFALIVFLIFLIGGEVSVPVNTIGVPQAFGTVAGAELGSGAHWTFKPWITTTDVDETFQQADLTGSNCLNIRIGGQQTACANIHIKYQVRASAADALFKDYSGQGNLMDTVWNSVVFMDLENVTNKVMGDYDPITDVQNVAGTSNLSLFTTFGPTIQKDMQHDIGNQINVVSLTLPSLQYTSAVEGKLQAIQQSYADYAIAAENVKVNEENALALQKLGTPSLNELVAQCLTATKTDTNLQCIPGATSNLQLSQGK